MRTLTGVSRLFLLAAISVAALLVLGGAYFIGYVGQLERELSDPASAPQRTAAQIATVEHALGHAGFLKSYRDYWTGDANAQAEFAKRSNEAAGALQELKRLTAGEAAPMAAMREIEAVVSVFTQAAGAAPATPPSGLRGVTEDSVKSLPSVGQLETDYLTLATSFERLREAARASQVRRLEGLLDRAQILIGVTLAALISGLLVVAWLMRFGIIQPLNSLERSLSAAAKGLVTPRIWGTERSDEIGELARAGEAMRRGLAELPMDRTLTDQGPQAPEGPGSILLETLAAQMTGAVEALKNAASATEATGTAQHAELNAAIGLLGQACSDIRDATASLRGEVSRLVEHVDEERLLPSPGARGPIALLEGPSASRDSPRTLADVPKAEVLERLGDLAAEMHAAAHNGADPESVKSSLAGLADEMRQLGTAPETRRTSDELSTMLTRHADAIEAHAAQPTPMQTELRGELSAVGRELRQVLGRAKNGSGAGAAARVAEAAGRIEERARRLFAQLEAADGIAEEDLSLETASADVEALATLVGKLEARAEALSEQAVARRFEEASNKGSPAELTEKAFAADQRTDGAIQTVFEAIERLNNIAAALARAGDAERQRRSGQLTH